MCEIKLEILTNLETLSRWVANWMLDLTTAKEGIFTVCLSGGSTPRRLYERLADPSYLEAFPWSRTHWFWGDERLVPHDDVLSNYRMAREALLSHAPIPAINIHPIPTEGLSPEAAASAYEHELKSFYGAGHLDPARPLFDLTFLGLGPDGHAASLFPGSSLLAERGRWVAAAVGIKPEARIMLLFPRAPKQPAGSLSDRGGREARHLRTTSPRQSESAGRAFISDRRAMALCRCGGRIQLPLGGGPSCEWRPS